MTKITDCDDWFNPDPCIDKYFKTSLFDVKWKFLDIPEDCEAVNNLGFRPSLRCNFNKIKIVGSQIVLHSYI